MKIFIFSRHIINKSKNRVELLDSRLKEEILLLSKIPDVEMLFEDKPVVKIAGAKPPLLKLSLKPF